MNMHTTLLTNTALHPLYKHLIRSSAYIHDL